MREAALLIYVCREKKDSETREGGQVGFLIMSMNNRTTPGILNSEKMAIILQSLSHLFLIPLRLPSNDSITEYLNASQNHSFFLMFLFNILGALWRNSCQFYQDC